MSDLDEVVTSPGFALVVAASWTVLVAVIAYLFGKNDGFGDGLAEGRRRYLQDVGAERRRWRDEEEAQRRRAALNADVATLPRPRGAKW
jgi:hypothetical protein